MNKTNAKLSSTLFLRQSYIDNWDDYQRSLTQKKFVKWDYIILTASNEDQATAYRTQIDYRLQKGYLPYAPHYAVLPDPKGQRVGSGGATLNVLKYVQEHSGLDAEHCFENKRILVIHSGGDSKRVPQYSACGKLFSPVPRELPDGRRSTLFDEFIISTSGIPSRLQDGMLILSGDVLLLFNPLQIDFQGNGAACISFKEDVQTGKNHGVFLADNNGNVSHFLHKQSVETLTNMGAVNSRGKVDIDTGAVLFSSDLVRDLYSLITTNNKCDKKKFSQFVNDKVRLSFYADFIYPLATSATLEDYYTQTPEGDFSDELTVCRKALWDTISKYNMRLLALSPAEFIHFGTTKELLSLMTEKIDEYTHLDWKRSVNSARSHHNCASNSSYISENCEVADSAYLEDSLILPNTKIGENCVLSNITLSGVTVPDNTVMHCLRLKNSKYVTRIYSVCDNPKDTLEKGNFMGISMQEFMKNANLTPADLWGDSNEHYLWFAKLYIPCDTIEKSVAAALELHELSRGRGDSTKFVKKKRVSLYESFNSSDVTDILPWQAKLSDKIFAYRFIENIKSGMSVMALKESLGDIRVNRRQIKYIERLTDNLDFSEKIRVYYYLSKVADKAFREEYESKCFDTIGQTIYSSSKISSNSLDFKIAKNKAEAKLAVRVNFGGGWSDTPPYCNENGGTVLNAALKLNGKLPIIATAEKLEEKKIILYSADNGAYGEFDKIEDILDCKNPFDPFALHKAALIACGFIPLEPKFSLEEILTSAGGGVKLSTQVLGIPRGSGLGTSSILAGACQKALHNFFGLDGSDANLFNAVLIMEQLMSTGGGWQDQVGGLVKGFKLISTLPGLSQNIKCDKLTLTDETKKELDKRFAIIYTGQRRLARNLLRDVIGNYLGAREQSLEALREIQRVAVLMRYELEKGNVDSFASLLSEHWELSKKLDIGCTNTCIDQIFASIDDLICGKMICGAGGGGFLQIILKKGVTKHAVSKRLHDVFQDSGVDVWDCSFDF